jgi:hypothetical protein
MRLGEFLVSRNLISREDLTRALEYQKKSGGKLGRILVMNNFITEDKLLSALKYHLEIPILDLEEIDIGPEVLKRVPKKIAEKYSLLPVKITTSFGKRTLLVVMSNPMDIEAINEVEFAAGVFVQPVIAKERDLMRALNKYYGIETGYRFTEQKRESVTSDKDDMTIIMGGKQFTIYEDRPPLDIPNESKNSLGDTEPPTFEIPKTPPPERTDAGHNRERPEDERKQSVSPPAQGNTASEALGMSEGQRDSGSFSLKDLEQLYTSLPPASKKQLMKIIITRLVRQKKASLNEIEQWFKARS